MSGEPNNDNGQRSSTSTTDHTLPPAGGNFGTLPEWIQVGLKFACCGGSAFYVGRKMAAVQVRAVGPLYQYFASLHQTLAAPIIPFSLNPYVKLEQSKALIVQGGNKTGKTTCLAVGIPWYRRGGLTPLVRPTFGLYFNGAKGRAVSSFDMWVTTQMFGSAAQGGAEVEFALDQHNKAHWLNRISALVPLPRFMQPARPIVVVDQLEELMKRFPAESLDWINQMTNAHVRDNKMRLILVVNSEDAVKSIQGLNQGTRWKVCTLGKVDKPPDTIDAKYFADCDSNIGLYKQLKEQEVSDTDVRKKAQKVLGRWRTQFHVPYPLLAAKSWRRLSVVELKKQLLSELEKVISAEKLTILRPHVEELEKEQILAATQKEWEVRLISIGFVLMDAEPLAVRVKTVLGKEAPKVDDAPAPEGK